MSTPTPIVGEVTLYGNRETGAGWLAVPGTAGPMSGPASTVRLLGDGEPRKHRTFNDAVWLALDALRGAGVKSGKVRVYAAGGLRCGLVDINHPPYFGDIQWTPAAPAVVLTVDQVLAAAE